MTKPTARMREGMNTEHFRRFGDGALPGHLGVEILSVSEAGVDSRLAVRREVMAPNGYLHAASVVALADIGHLPPVLVCCDEKTIMATYR